MSATVREPRRELTIKDGIAQVKPEPVQSLKPLSLRFAEGIIQFSGEGRPTHSPADSLSAKEALALVLYSTHRRPSGRRAEHSLGSSWKTTSGAVVRARASE